MIERWRDAGLRGSNYYHYYFIVLNFLQEKKMQGNFFTPLLSSFMCDGLETILTSNRNKNSWGIHILFCGVAFQNKIDDNFYF